MNAAGGGMRSMQAARGGVIDGASGGGMGNWGSQSASGRSQGQLLDIRDQYDGDLNVDDFSMMTIMGHKQFYVV
jgi:hypothetical protein